MRENGNYDLKFVSFNNLLLNQAMNLKCAVIPAPARPSRSDGKAGILLILEKIPAFARLPLRGCGQAGMTVRGE